MSTVEMNRRLAAMSPATIEQISYLVREGWGAHSIFSGGVSGVTIKQINAVFALVQAL